LWRERHRLPPPGFADVWQPAVPIDDAPDVPPVRYPAIRVDTGHIRNLVKRCACRRADRHLARVTVCAYCQEEDSVPASSVQRT